MAGGGAGGLFGSKYAGSGTPSGHPQPPGEVETMYQVGIYGASAGRRIVIAR